MVLNYYPFTGKSQINDYETNSITIYKLAYRNNRRSNKVKF